MYQQIIQAQARVQSTQRLPEEVAGLKRYFQGYEKLVTNSLKTNLTTEPNILICQDMKPIRTYLLTRKRDDFTSRTPTDLCVARGDPLAARGSSGS